MATTNPVASAAALAEIASQLSTGLPFLSQSSNFGPQTQQAFGWA
jgi:hypothetical protein